MADRTPANRLFRSPNVTYFGGRPYEEIVAIVRNRQIDGTPLYNSMLEVRDRYNGPAVDYVLPHFVPEDTDANQTLIPLLMAEIIDNDALFAASMSPSVFTPAVNGATQKGTGSREWARRRTYSINDVCKKSRFKLGKRRLYRQLSAYGSCNAIVYPDDTTQCPRIEIRDALTAFPDLRAAEDFRTPEDMAYITGRSAEWLRRVYPESQNENGGPVEAVPGIESRLWDVVEWIDADIISIGILAPRETRFGQSNYHSQHEGGEYMELRRWPNKAGFFPGMCPARVTLDTILSQCMNVVGHIDMQTKLMILDVIQSEKAIMPDMYMLGADGRPPRILSNEGEWVDGRTGLLNELLNVEAVGTLSTQPDPLARATIDRIERNVKSSLGNVPAMQGETYGALRTGRGIDTMLDAAVQPRIHEMHEIMEEWMPDLFAGILGTYKGYYGPKTYSLYAGPNSKNAQVEFVPNTHVETLDNYVQYPVPGADVVQTDVILTRMHGSGLASMRTVRRKHPYVDGDGDEETDYINEERAEETMREAIFQRVVAGQAPLILLSLFEKHVRNGDDAIVAADKAHTELQEMQAQQAPEPEAAGQVMAPQVMPGADAGPGGAAMQLPETQVGPTADQSGMRELFNAINAIGPQ